MGRPGHEHCYTDVETDLFNAGSAVMRNAGKVSRIHHQNELDAVHRLRLDRRFLSRLIVAMRAELGIDRG